MAENLPDFIGIGAQKCATTWITACLKEHPEICISNPPEANFFNAYSTYYRNRSGNYKKGIEWYKEKFNHCSKDSVKGEFDPYYLYDKQAPQRIYDCLPNVKLIVSLRNPMERAYSNYFHDLYKLSRENKGDYLGSFPEAIQKEGEIIGRGLYYKQLIRYFNLFPEENILVVFYFNLQKDPKSFIQKIYDFLNVDNNFVPSKITRKLNQNRNDYFSSLSSFVNEVYKLISKSDTLKNIVYSLHMDKIGSFIKEVNSVPTKKQADPERLKDLYEKFYKKDIENLEKLLDKDLSIWKK